MIRIKRILVAYDFSDTAKQAAITAFAFARKRRADVHLLTVDVIEPPAPEQQIWRTEPYTSLDQIAERIRAEAQQLLDEAGIEPDELTVTHAAIRDVTSASGIIGYAEEHDFDLIIAGTHGYRGIRRALLGSVAAEIVRRATCPVMTVGNVRPEASGQIRRVMLPVDFSEPTEAAVQYAAVVAGLFDARLHVVHVLEEVNSEEIYGFRPSVFAESEAYKVIRGRLQRLLRQVAVKTTPHVLLGRPDTEIIDFATQKNIDLIVVPTRGQTGLRRILLGSVAEKIITAAPCPVISAKDFQPFLLTEESAASG